MSFSRLSSEEFNEKENEEDVDSLLNRLSSDAINSQFDERLDTKGPSANSSGATSPAGNDPGSRRSPTPRGESRPQAEKEKTPEASKNVGLGGLGGLASAVTAATTAAAVAKKSKRTSGKTTSAASSSGHKEVESTDAGSLEKENVAAAPDNKKARILNAILNKRFQSGDQSGESDLDLKMSSQQGRPSVASQQQQQQQQQPPAGSKTTSAPTSPMKDKRASFFGKVSNFSQVVSAKVEQAKDVAGSIRVPGLSKDKCFTLLVIDDDNTDWSKYFRGRRIHGGEYDIRVEQAEFRELAVSASSESGVTASIVMHKTGSKVVRSFKPDFLLVRQNLRDANDDFRSLLLGFKYGDVPSVNSLESIYNFQDKPWVFAEMIKMQKKLGKEVFPLIDQTYYPNQREMQAPTSSRFPCVLKIAHAHGGTGKAKIENTSQFQDLTSVIAISDSYCTMEPYIDAKFDLHVQKIGSNYKAWMRKSLSGNWKTNIGQSILEEIPVEIRYRTWIDAMSRLFGGLDICSLEVMVAKDGQEFIIEVNDSATTLMGESQEEDRKNIADLVARHMEEKCKPPAAAIPAAAAAASSGSTPAPVARTSSRSSISRSSIGGGDQSKVVEKAAAAPKTVNNSTAPVQQQQQQQSAPPLPTTTAAAASTSKARARHDSQASESSTVSGVSSGSRNSSSSRAAAATASNDTKASLEHSEANPEAAAAPEGEDTMKNLRKTFAGIFGDIN